MKKSPIILFLLTALLVTTSCTSVFNSKVTIYLNFDNGEPEVIQEVTIGSRLSDIDVPPRENSIFTKWYRDPNLSQAYTSPFLTTTIRLYAGYDLDLHAIEEDITAYGLSSVVTVETHNSKSIVGGGVQKSVAQGSGVIFHQDVLGYYVLTNNHVTVAPNDGEYTQAFYILDSDQNILYSAQRLDQSNNYDLAVLRFQSLESYYIPHIENDKVYANRSVIAIGTPKGIYNTVTYGKTLGFARVYLDDAPYLSNVEFPVIVHDAVIDHGSSGGPLFDYKLDVIGINFASGENDENDPVSVAIPNLEVLNYLALVDDSYGTTA